MTALTSETATLLSLLAYNNNLPTIAGITPQLGGLIHESIR
jgi:hypothetical protein